MKKAPAIAMTLLLAACSSSSGRTAEPISWEAGRYTLEASVSSTSGGIRRSEDLNADLVITSGGELSLFASSGVCQDPELTAQGSDVARGRRTFVCGDVRYELQPAGNTVRGRIYTTVTQEKTVTVCVRYTTTPTGDRVCAETQERIEQVKVPVSAQLVVRFRADR